MRALDLKGLPLGDATFAFKDGERETEAELTLPVEIRNDIARLEIAGERSAGAVALLDKRWRRRSIGVITGSTADTAQPLLASTYYLTRALGPFADVRLADRGSPAQAVSQFIEQRLPMMILADVGNVAEAREQLTRWIEEGGVLVRFAGPRLAAADDDLVPVKLRRGGRVLGGSLSWEQPQQLAAFARESPFFGMAVPTDVTVSRQVLAEPDATLTERTWATLADGTPLVTAQRRGKGLVVLFHVTADTRWSDLPLSGTFVEMLKRIVTFAGSIAAADANAAARARREVLPPTRVLDGFGIFGPPPPTARPVPASFAGRATFDHPPGFYGPPEGLLAVNALAPADRLAPLDVSALNARREAYRMSEPEDLRGPILLAALALLALDALDRLHARRAGFAQLMRRRRPAAAALAHRRSSARRSRCAAGPRAEPAADLLERTAPVAPARPGAERRAGAEIDAGNPPRLRRHRRCRGRPHQQGRAAGPHAVPGAAHRARGRRADRDRSRPRRACVLSADLLAGRGERAEAVARGARAYRRLHEAGRHRAVRHPRRGRGAARPRRRDPRARHAGAAQHSLGARHSRARAGAARPCADQDVLSAEGLSRPLRLRPALGRGTAAANEDEPASRPARAGDGVSSIIITSNDFAGAWAMRQDGQAMLPLVSAEPRQREFAFRAGVNIVMYTLTGNYKADQVHIPALLERLGQ